jgi:hypothetical protein
VIEYVTVTWDLASAQDETATLRELIEEKLHRYHCANLRAVWFVVAGHEPPPVYPPKPARKRMSRRLKKLWRHRYV